MYAPPAVSPPDLLFSQATPVVVGGSAAKVTIAGTTDVVLPVVGTAQLPIGSTQPGACLRVRVATEGIGESTSATLQLAYREVTQDGEPITALSTIATVPAFEFQGLNEFAVIFTDDGYIVCGLPTVPYPVSVQTSAPLDPAKHWQFVLNVEAAEPDALTINSSLFLLYPNRPQ